MIIENVDGEQTVLNSAKAEYDIAFDRQIDKGMKKYDTVLKTFNGRDAGQDALEELVDLSVYLAQLRMENAALKEILFYVISTSEIGEYVPLKIYCEIHRHAHAENMTSEDARKKWLGDL